MSGSSRGIRLDWSGKRMPHAVLDLLRGCNACCDGCYNARDTPGLKPLSQIRAELQKLIALRQLQAVSLTGGEPLLHPDLDAVVRDIRGLGLRSVLMTNGVCLNASRARQLKEAGLDMVLLHIQSRQNRPDMSADSPQALRRLRDEKASCARSVGLDVGFSALMYADENSHREIEALVEEVKHSDAVHFLMICPKADFTRFSNLQGSLKDGYRDGGGAVYARAAEENIGAEAETLYRLLQEAGFDLFAWLGSSDDPDALRWSTWGAGVLKRAFSVCTVPLPSVWTDRLLLRAHRFICGRNIMHVRPSAARFRFQLALSLLSRDGVRAAGPLLAGSLQVGVRLMRKHVMIELPPVLTPSGTVVFCRECPDATLHEGRLVPPCLRDRLGCGSDFRPNEVDRRPGGALDSGSPAVS